MFIVEQSAMIGIVVLLSLKLNKEFKGRIK